MRTLVLALVLLCATTVAGMAPCQFPIPGTFECLTVQTTPLRTWEAAAACNDIGGSLVAPRSAAELDQLLNITNPPYSPTDEYYVGVHGYTALSMIYTDDLSPATFLDFLPPDPEFDTGRVAVTVASGSASPRYRHKYETSTNPYVCRGGNCPPGCLACSGTACTACLPYFSDAACTVLSSSFCSVPSLANGNIVCSASGELGSVCTATCNPGYTLQGNRTFTCRSRYEWQGYAPYWSGQLPYCADSTLVTFVNSASLVTNRFGGRVYRIHTSLLSYAAAAGVCRSSYGMSLAAFDYPGEYDAVRYLVDGDVWIGLAIEPDADNSYLRGYASSSPLQWITNVTADPSTIPDDQGSVARINDVTGEADEIDATFDASTGRYALCEGIKCPGNCAACTGTPAARTCIACMDGWASPPACDTLVAAACPLPTPIANGVYTGVDQSLGGTATAACNVGFALVGSASRVCAETTTFGANTSPELEDTNELTDGSLYNEFDLLLGTALAAVEVQMIEPLVARSFYIDFTTLGAPAPPSPPAPFTISISIDATINPSFLSTSGGVTHDISSRTLSPISIPWTIDPVGPLTVITTPDLAPLLNWLHSSTSPPSVGNRVVIVFGTNASIADPVAVDAYEAIHIAELGLRWTGSTPSCVELQPEATCPPANRFAAACYVFDDTLRTYQDAARSCEALGGHVAVPDSQGEWDKITSVVNFTTVTVNTWLGGIRPSSYARFLRTSTGLPYDGGFTFWRGGQPNEPVVQDGLEFNTEPVYMADENEALKWQDRETSELRHTVCELPLCLEPCATCGGSQTECLTCIPGFALPPLCNLGLPAAPASTGVTLATKTTIAIGWGPPPGLSSLETGLVYQVYVDRNPLLDAEGAVAPPTSSRSATIPNLAPGTEYSVRVQSIGLAGAGGESSPIAVKTLVQCTAGHAPVGDGTTCTKCEPGAYSSDGNVCLLCPSLTASPSNATDISACLCLPGYFNAAPVATGSAPTCKACVEGGVCAGGSAAPVAAPGFYPGAGGTGTVFVACPNTAACTGDGRCADGYTGRLCAECRNGFYQLSGECKRCSALGSLLIGLFVVAAFVVVAFLVWFNTKQRSMYKFAAFVIGLNSLQISALYGQLPLSWPSYARAFFDALSFANLNLDLTSPECGLGASHVWRFKYLVSMFMPLALLLPFGVVFLVTEAYARWVDAAGPEYARTHTEAMRATSGFAARWARFRTESHIRGAAMVAVMGRAYWQLLQILFLPLTSIAIRYFDCEKSVDGRLVHVASPADECYSGGHLSWLALAVIAALAYCIGLPATVTYLLFRRRKQLNPVAFHLKYGFLVARFRDAHYAYEVAIMLRKLGVVLALTSSWAVANAHNKAFYAVAVLGVAMTHLAFSKPYLDVVHNALAVFCIASSVVILYLGAASQLDSTFRDVAVCIALSINVVGIVGGMAFDAWRWATMAKAIEAEYGDGDGDAVVVYTNSFGGGDLGSAGEISMENGIALDVIGVDDDAHPVSVSPFSSVVMTADDSACGSFPSASASAVVVHTPPPPPLP